MSKLLFINSHNWLTNKKLDLSDVNLISKDDYEQINKRSKVSKGDIIYSMIGSIGNYALINYEPVFAIKNVALFKLSSNDKIDSKYFYYLLDSEIIKNQILQKLRGGNQKFVSLKVLRNLKIPLPPIETQQKIAEILEKADTIRRRNQQILKKYDQLLLSIFLDMFGDPVKNEKGWEYILLEEIIVDGPQNGLYKPSKDYGSGVPILRIDSFYDGIVTGIDSLKRVKVTSGEQKKYQILEDDIVINRVNSRSHLGKCGLIPKLNEPTVFESNMMRFSVDRKRVSPIYLVRILGHKFVRNQILTCAKDAVNQSSINQKDVNSFTIPLPPIELQNRFAQVVERIEKQKAQVKESLQQSENLFQSLLQIAFKGELFTERDHTIEEINAAHVSMAAEPSGQYRLEL